MGGEPVDLEETQMDHRQNERTSMVRHAERLVAGVERRPAGATRVRKRVVTEVVTVEVEVQREVLELEELRHTDGVLGDERARLGAVEAAELAERADGREELEEIQTVTLHRQRPVVTLETVPYEEARVLRRRVVVPHEATETVRAEHVDIQHLDVDGTVLPDFR